MPPTLLVIAGPNGSGKSTLTEALRDRGIEFPNYLNADEIALTLSGTADERTIQAQRIVVERRNELLDAGASVAYETVMSHPSHVDFMRKARATGYDIHLYFIGTEDAAINVGRVADRVAKGGHDVPTDRTIERYRRVMRTTLPAILGLATYAEFFDNSGAYPIAVARLNGNRLELLVDRLPSWIVRYLMPHVGTGNSVTLQPTSKT
jgi:predicted ABC-type ATPase